MAHIMQDFLESKIRRTRLPFMNESQAGKTKVTILRAPIGFGKTTLLRQWHADALSSRRRTGWLTLGPADRSIDKLAASLARHTSLFPDCRTSRPADKLRSAFTQDEAQGFALFLDNWDAIRGSASEGFVANLLATVDVRLHLYIACRKAATLPIEHLIGLGRLRLIGMEALKFSDNEQRRFIGEKDWSNLPHSVLVAFDGWPLAFSLLKANEHAADKSIQEPAVFARQSGLEDIVAKELEASCGDQELSILNILGLGADVDLTTLQHLSGIDDAAQSFDDVASLLPCRPYAHGATMRYQFSPLLLPLLERRFDRLGKKERGAILRKAYDRSIRRGRTLDAIGFALLDGKGDKAVALLEAIGPLKLVLIYGIEPVDALLRKIPLDLLGHAFRSRLAMTVIHAKGGHLVEAREMVDAVMDDIATSPLDSTSKRQALRDAMFARIQIAALSEKDWMEVFEQGTRTELAKEPAFAAWARICLGLAHQQAGRLDAADAEFRRSEAASIQFGAAYQLIHLRLHRALVELARGRLRSARRALRNLSVDVRASYPSDISLMAAIETASLETSLLTSRTSVQWEALSAVIGKLTQSDGLYDVFGMAFTNAARFLYATNPEALMPWLDEAERDLRESGLTHVIGLVRAIRAFYAAVSGRPDVAEKALARPQTLEKNETPQLSWREHHFQSMASALVACHFGDHDKADAIARDLVAACRRDGRRIALIEASLNHAKILIDYGARDDEGSDLIMFALETADELGTAGLLDEWRSLIEPLAGDLIVRFKPSARRMIEGLLRQWRDQVRPDLFSAREAEILAYIGNGLSNKLIAHELMIGTDTVKYHLKRIFSKLNVHGRDDAVARARSAGVI